MTPPLAQVRPQRKITEREYPGSIGKWHRYFSSKWEEEMPAPDYLLPFITEDAPFGDITSEAIIGDVSCHAVITTHEAGVIAGLTEAAALFGHFGATILEHSIDGSEVAAGTIVLSLEGPAMAILLVERTALNIIGRMSGIATRTRKMSSMILTAGGSCRLSATRKTAPGLRFLDKKAVLLGGGDPHRMSLSDGILIKDNHLVLVPLVTAIRRAKERSLYRKIEVEVSAPADALSAAKAGADIILLDNMTPTLVREALQLCKDAGVMERLIIEVSGNIDETNLLSYTIPGVDRISSGILTHSVRNQNVSLDIIGIPK
jgi:nicotinate-nucleotide pyrophosphorylase (carboxylating)